jgi:hypothetical protein
MGLFVVPTIGFKLVYGFVIVWLHRRDLVWINVTTNPTAEWVARQITEALPNISITIWATGRFLLLEFRVASPPVMFSPIDLKTTVRLPG